MGTPGPPGGFDIQNFFSRPPQSPAPGFNSPSDAFPSPNIPFHPPTQPFTSSNYPPANPYPSSTTFPSLLGSYTFSTQIPYNPYSYHDHGPRPPPYPSPPTIQPSFLQQVAAPISSLPPSASPHSSFSQLTSRSPISSPPMDGARLMALLNTCSATDSAMKDESMPPLLMPPNLLELPLAGNLSESFQGRSQISSSPAAMAPVLPSAPPVSLAPPAMPRALSSSKLPRGRHLKGDHIIYDIDVHFPGETQPQLEVSPVTVYGSDPIFVVGRQIAVNSHYICYGLRAGNIRILNTTTALKAMLRGHSQRVTDMVFFAEDVPLLASASSDGRVFIWRIVEGIDEEGKMQISEEIVLAVQFLGDWESAHPRVCWYPHFQDLLGVGIGKYLFTIDILRVRMASAPAGFTSDNPVKCYVDTPIEGIRCVDRHDADVTDISTSERIHLASASKDGLVRIWEDKKMLPMSSFKPHNGQPVGSVAFLSAPCDSESIILLTSGPLNRELKLWVPSGESWFLQPGKVNWKCIQTLELKSSSEEKVEDAFFNQVLVIHGACLILLANAKRNAIYVLHIRFGLNPSASRIDYLAEFSVTMPILSLTATSGNVLSGESVIQIYCVQTQAIQRYSLDLLHCRPPPTEESLMVSGLSTESSLPNRSSSAMETGWFGGRVKSPDISSRARSPGIPSGVGNNTLHSNTCELHSSQEQLSTFTIEQGPVPDCQHVMASVLEEIDENLTGENPPILPKILAPTPQSGMVPVSPIGSPLARKSGRPSLNTTLELADKPLQMQEQSWERKVEDANLESIALSSQVVFDDNLKENGSKESSCHVTSGIMEQQTDLTPMHLITPSELMSMIARSKVEADGGLTTLFQAAISSKDLHPVENDPGEGTTEMDNIFMETKDVAESSKFFFKDEGQDAFMEKSGCIALDGKKSQTGLELEDKSMQSPFLEQAGSKEIQQVEEGNTLENTEHEQLKKVSVRASDFPAATVASQPPDVTKGRKNNSKTNAVPQGVKIPPYLQGQPGSAINMIASEGDLNVGANADIFSFSNLGARILEMQESVSQLVSSHKDLQKQMAVMVAVPVTKECKRMEASLGQRIEKVLKAHVDAIWARIQEENAKREKLERDRTQQLATMLSSSINKELPAAVERCLKKEISTIGPSVGHLVAPSFEKTIINAANEVFQKGIGEKGIAQLEKSVGAKLEASFLRQFQSQFQTTGRQALQEGLRSCFEAIVVPGFERSCKAMFEQVDVTFRRGMAEHTAYTQQQIAASHNSLASTLQDTVASASSLAASLKGVADEQSKLLAKSGASAHFFSNKQSSGGLPDKAVTVRTVEMTLDPTIELSRLVGEGKLEEAFSKALSLSDIAVVSWLSTQVDPGLVFKVSPLPLSQRVLLVLIQQLSYDLGNNTARKLTWIREAALALNPSDPALAPLIHRVSDELYQKLSHHMLSPNVTAEQASSVRLIMHVANSLRTSCK